MGHSPICPYTVERASMTHRWDRVTFLHWSYPPDSVQRLLPPGLSVHTFDGRAWVGLVPFFMEVGIFGAPPIPWLLEFPETNVRTYVTGPDGTAGVWFFSLDAARSLAVITARATYRVPYFRSRMSVERRGDVMRYTAVRRWPDPSPVRSDVVVEIADRYPPDELTEFDHYLTARWVLFGTWGGRLLRATAWHGPWPLHRARATLVDDGLVAAAGFSRPEDPPVVHWSPGVDVRIGYPTRAD